jgi:hypothetical protein
MGIKKKLKRIAQVAVPIGTTVMAGTPLAPISPIIPFIVRGLEATFGAKTGETKKKIAVNMALQVARQLQTAGVLPAQLDETELDELIEAEVAEMNEDGYEPITQAPQENLALRVALAALELAVQKRDGEI